jgi:hypothetical protein
MACENCDCAENSDVRTLKRRIDELERTVGLQGQGILKVTRALDDATRYWKKRIEDLETEFTYHGEIPHPGAPQ